MIYFAQKAFIVQKNQLLMVRKSPNDTVQPNKWEVPGRRMIEGETLDEHIRREVFEETGITVTPNQTFYAWQWRIPMRSDSKRFDTVIAIARFCHFEHGFECGWPWVWPGAQTAAYKMERLLGLVI